MCYMKLMCYYMISSQQEIEKTQEMYLVHQ